MPFTPDDYPGQRVEDTILLVSGAAAPVQNGEVRYVQGQGFKFFEEGVVKSLTGAVTGTWRDPGNTFVTTGSVSIDTSNRTAIILGTDVFFFVSGSTTASSGVNRKVVLFGGDVVSSGSVTAVMGLSGSLTRLSDGTSYLVAGSNITVASSSNGQVIVSAVSQGADPGVAYVTVGNTSSLPNERALTGGTGILLTDGGANSTVTLAIKDNIVATVSGANFSGPVLATGGVSGSLQQTTAGTSYLVAGQNITVTSGSGATGQVVIAAPGVADIGAAYVTIGNTSSLPNERSLTAGVGLLLTDAGANSTVTLAIKDNIVATVSGTIFEGATSVDTSRRTISSLGTDVFFFVSGSTTASSGANRKVALFGGDVVSSGSVTAVMGLSGSLTRLSDGTSYLVAGSNVSIASSSNGQVIISAGSADPGVAYVTIGNTSSLSNERALAGGTGVLITDGGANSTVTVAIKDNIVATVSGTNFSGPVLATGGLSGSLQQTTSGLSYLVAGSNVTITSGSGATGQVVIAATNVADIGAAYVTIGNTSSLSNERALTAGTGLLLTDAGANSTVTLGVRDNIVATVSGTIFEGATSVDTSKRTISSLGTDVFFFVSGSTTSSSGINRKVALFGGDVVSSGSVTAVMGMSGSHTRLADGTSYLVAGSNVTIASSSNGQVIVSAVSQGADPGVAYVTIGNTSSLPNERALTAGTGILATDAGANSTITLAIKDNIVATVSGTNFSGPVLATGGLSGSLQQTTAGTSYLVAGSNVTITSGSGATGQVVIAAANVADIGAAYVTIGNTSSLPNERALTGGTGILLTDAGANSTVTLGIKDNIVATVSGTIFEGATSVDTSKRTISSLGTDVFFFVSGSTTSSSGANRKVALFGGDVVSSGSVTAVMGLSGSHTRLADGTSYLVAGSNVSIASSSNGQVIISAGSADPGVAYVTIGNTSSLANERALTGGTGVLITDGGANSTVTVAIKDNIVATVSGTNFSGPVLATGGLSGSLQQTTAGTSYLVAGSNVTITSGSGATGQIVIAAPGVADIGAAYVTIGNTSSLPNERALTGGTGILLTDAGANSTVTLAIKDNIVATVSGTIFEGATSVDTSKRTISSLGTDVFFFVSGSTTSSSGANRKVALFGGDVVSSGSITAKLGLSGSLTKLSDGTSYLVAGSNVTVASSSNGQVVVSAIQGSSVQWTDGGAKIYTTSSVSIDASSRYANLLGTDVFFFVSGSRNRLSGNERHITLLGGDTVSSGNLTFGTSSAQSAFIRFPPSYLNGSAGDGTYIEPMITIRDFDNSGDIKVASSYSTTGYNQLAFGDLNTLLTGVNIVAKANGFIDMVFGNSIPGFTSARFTAGSFTLGPDTAGGIAITFGTGSARTGNIRVPPAFVSSYRTVHSDADAEWLAIDGTDSVYLGNITLNALSATVLCGNPIIFYGNNGVMGAVAPTGAQFLVPYFATGGISGSLQQTSAGTSYLVAGQNVTITSGSGPTGQIVIDSTSPSAALTLALAYDP